MQSALIRNTFLNIIIYNNHPYWFNNLLFLAVKGTDDLCVCTAFVADQQTASDHTATPFPSIPGYKITLRKIDL